MPDLTNPSMAGHPPVVKRYVKGVVRIRRGRGFSVKEIKESGLGLDLAKRMGIYIDFRRRSSHQENVRYLKALAKRFGKEKAKNQPAS